VFLSIQVHIISSFSKEASSDRLHVWVLLIIVEHTAETVSKIRKNADTEFEMLSLPAICLQSLLQQ